MPQKSSVIVKEITAHIEKQGGPYSAWYVGIAADVKKRLHEEHNVPRENYWFIYREAFNADAARDAEATLLEYGCKGGTGGGDEDTRFVYAYLIGPETRE